MEKISLGHLFIQMTTPQSCDHNPIHMFSQAKASFSQGHDNVKKTK
jgi:hypothetical protein